MEEDATKLTPYLREKTLKAVTQKIEDTERASAAKEQGLIQKLQEQREDFKNGLPKWLRWVIPSLSWEKARWSKPINRAGMSVADFIYCFYEEPLGRLQEIKTLCERSNGETILLDENQSRDLHEAISFTMPESHYPAAEHLRPGSNPDPEEKSGKQEEALETIVRWALPTIAKAYAEAHSDGWKARRLMEANPGLFETTKVKPEE